MTQATFLCGHWACITVWEIWVKIAPDCHMTSIDVENVWKITNKENLEPLNVSGHYNVAPGSNLSSLNRPDIYVVY